MGSLKLLVFTTSPINIVVLKCR